MDWLTDNLPLLLVMSPLIGCLLTIAAIRIRVNAVRPLAAAASTMVFVSFFASAGQYHFDRIAEAAARQLTDADRSDVVDEVASQELVNQRVDRQIAERRSRMLFVFDGTNQWPVFALVLLTAILTWQRDRSGTPGWFVPATLMVESASLAAMTAADLRVYLIAFPLDATALSVMIGLWGGADRRLTASRFLVSQICGAALIMLGFAMLVVAVPWMKIEDAPSPLTISTHIATIVFEIQQWANSNPLSFHYRTQLFPWILFLLSTGFAIQFGCFPFHWPVIAIISDGFKETGREVPLGSTVRDRSQSIAVLYLVGLSSACGLGWLRFVVPVAPELLAGFDWLILVPSLGGAVWGSLFAVSVNEPRRQAAYLYLGLSGLSLIGCYVMSRFALSGTWLMQQQLIATFCAALFVLHRTARLWSTRSLVVLLALPLLGFFGSGYLIFSDVLEDATADLRAFGVAVGILIAYASIVVVIKMLLQRHLSATKFGNSAPPQMSHPWSFAGALLLMVVANLLPGVLLSECEPDLVRIYRRFEQPYSADSAEPRVDVVQTSR